MDSVKIFDTTLRDGEQSPGFSMNTEEKIRMARQLAALGVDVIEAGFPISSRGDLEAVQTGGAGSAECADCGAGAREEDWMWKRRLRRWNRRRLRGCMFFWRLRICICA